MIIVGGGPAGITAGIYAARKKIGTLLLTEDFVGQVGEAFDIENYPGFKKIRGAELMEKLEEHLREFEVEVREGVKVEGVKKGEDFFEVRGEEEKFKAETVILATGRDPRPLEVPGEEELLGRGVSYCVTCDGPLFSGKKVAVVGGGNSGLEAALELATYCRHVYVLELGKEPAGDELLEEKIGKKENIELFTEAKTKRIKGEEEVESLVYEDLGSGERKELEVQGVFIEVGYLPATDFVKDLVGFNEWDEIEIDLETTETETEGLFAAGDVSSVRDKQIVVAAGEGAKAALSVARYLREKE